MVFPSFNENTYLLQNPDVKRAGMPALLHYELFGRKEKRKIGDGNSYLPRYSLKDLIKCIFYTRTLDLSKYREYNLLKAIIRSKYFDYKWYKTTYHISGNKKSIARHFLRIGWKLGYNPSVKFSCKDFLMFYNDVSKLNINPLVFYERNKRCLIPSTIKENVDFLLLSTCNKIDGVFIWRIQHLSESLTRKGYRVVSESISNPSKNFLNYLFAAKVIIVSRPNSQQIFKNIFHVIRYRNVPYFFDIDDLISVEKVNLSGAVCSDCSLYDRMFNNWIQQEQIYSMCKNFIVSTEKLCEHFSKNFNANVHIIPNVVVPDVLDNNFSKKRKINPEKFNLLYPSGSPTHDFDASSIVLDLLNFLNCHNDVYLTILGKTQLGELFKPLFPDRVSVIPFVPFNKMLEFYANSDLVLVPLVKNDFNNAKSNIKFIEAAIVSTPVLASSVDEFKKIITDGENGFLYENNFIEKLEFAYQNREYLIEIGNVAHETVSKKLTLNNLETSFLEEALC